MTSRSKYRRERFREAAFEITRYADLLVAVLTQNEFDDLVSGARGTGAKKGGSFETVEEARNSGTPVLILNHQAKKGEPGVAFFSGEDGAGFVRQSGADWVQSLSLPTIAPDVEHLIGHHEVASFDAASFDYAQVLHPIANLAKKVSREGKEKTRQLALVVLGLHVAATFAGVVGLMKDSLKAAAPAWLDWVVLAVGHPGAKVALLLAALSVALYEIAGKFHGHHDWLRSRRLAEVLTSAKVLAGLDRREETRLYRPFPGSLRHLRELGCGAELGSLIQSLNTLHLRETRQLAAEDVKQEFVKGYCAERLGEASDIPDNVGTRLELLRAALFGRDESGDRKGSTKSQIPYFRKESFRGKAARARLLLGFLVVQAIALAGATWAWSDYGRHDGAFLLLAKFGPVFLPVVGAALIAWLAYSDDERRSQSYPAVAKRLQELKTQLERNSGDESLKRDVVETESLILQDVSAWYERMSSMRV